MKRLVVWLHLMIFVVSAFSTDLSKVKFEYLTVDNGLSQGIIEDIFQDRQGYMWFCIRTVAPPCKKTCLVDGLSGRAPAKC